VSAHGQSVFSAVFSEKELVIGSEKELHSTLSVLVCVCVGGVFDNMGIVCILVSCCTVMCINRFLHAVLCPAGERALANFVQLPTRGPLGAGMCTLPGELVGKPPRFGPESRSAGR
jgi:hypothetical protein